jgi:hypothetical protein
VQRFSAIGVLLTVEIFIRLETRIVGVAELPRLFVRRGIAELRPFAAALMLV